jgi:hypothetical protein
VLPLTPESGGFEFELNINPSDMHQNDFYFNAAKLVRLNTIAESGSIDLAE